MRKSCILSNNKLKTLPEEIGNLKNLNYLDVSYNVLKELPSSLPQLKKLRELNLGNNFFADIPNGLIENLPELQVIILNNTKVSSRRLTALQALVDENVKRFNRETLLYLVE